MTAPVDAILARHRAVSIALLAVLTLLAWVWLVCGAGMGKAPGFSMPGLLPHDGMQQGIEPDMGMGGMPMLPGDSAPWWTASRFLLTFSMWWVMMVAMMLPSAAPMILLYARTAVSGGVTVSPATGSFLSGYLLVWGIFSLAAATLQTLLEQAGVLAGMEITSISRPFSGALLVATGLYQLSPVKEACLRQCRNPAQFLAGHYRPGRAGALRMGIRHGAFCAGCCWLLMALLFVGGVMNLAWIAFLTLVVAAEKMLPGGRGIVGAGGVLCLVWGGYILLT